MPGILPMKVIKVGNSAQARIAQACDRCRSKKIRCDGFRPSCTQCTNVGFECKTSDKLSRRAFPRGYTESLEERVRALELEIRELKDLLDAKDDKIDMLSKLHSPQHNSFSRRQSDNRSPTALDRARQAVHQGPSQHFRIQQEQSLHEDEQHDAHFVGTSNSCALLESVKAKAKEVDRPCPEFSADSITPTTCSKPPTSRRSSQQPSTSGPSRLLSDQMVNIFFQEWAPLFPVVHRQSFLKLYEQYTTDPAELKDVAEQIQLHLVFGIAATSNKTRITYDVSYITSQWLNRLDASMKKNTMTTLQCLLLAQMFCTQTGDWARVLQYKERSAGMAQFLGLNQSQKRFGFNILVSETRKKVFWSLYTLDCFTSAFLGTPKALNDRDIHCEYPMDVDDEYLSEQGIQPVLPGEFTKLSSALSIFNGARILSKVLTELYPSHAIYEVSMATISALDEELENWSNSLPPHLKMQFTDEKPSTNVISSRCPLLSLTFHYIRSLIHRPAACFAPHQLASASTVALASSSKCVIQLLALLDERNLSFSFPLNKDELLVTAGAGVLMQALNISRESKLMKDSQKTICSALEMLKRRKASEYSEFRRISCPMVFLNSDKRPQASRTGSDDHLQAKRDLQRLTSQFPASISTEHVHDNRRSTLPVMSAPIAAESSPSLSTSASTMGGPKRFRPIAPSTVSPRSSNEFAGRESASPRVVPSSRQQQIQRPVMHRPESTASASSSTVNLDFFRFPNESRPSLEHHQPGNMTQPPPSDWEKILASLGDEQLSLDTGVHDWSAFMPAPQDEVNIRQPPPKPAQAASIHSTTSNDDWHITTHAQHGAHGAPQLSGPLKTQSLFSYSEESLTSGEDFSSLDWGNSSGENDEAFKALMMASLSPDGDDVFGLNNEAARLSNEALGGA